MSRRPASRKVIWDRLTENTSALSNWLDGGFFKPLITSPTLQSGILLARCATTGKGQLNRSHLAEHGLVASTFPGGLLRMSMPEIDLSLHAMSLVSRALHHLAPNRSIFGRDSAVVTATYPAAQSHS